MDNDKIVIFDKYDDPFKANIIKGVLESNGIPAGVMDDGLANTIMKGISAGSVRLVVFERDLQRAREIVEKTQSSELDEFENT